MNYCYGCHSLKYSRYKRVAEDLSIPLEMYENNLIYDGSKIGELMNISLQKDDAIEWLGAYPPDLTLEARLSFFLLTNVIQKPLWSEHGLDNLNAEHCF